MELQAIQNKIYEIRGMKVMLDRDLEEVDNWKSQIVMSNSIKMGLRRNPYAFTELGVAMLSSILNTKIAIQINISIMRAFVAIRQLTTNLPQNEFSKLQQEVKELKAYIEEAFADYNDINEDTRTQLELINLSLAELQAKRTENQSRPRIGYVK